MSTAKERLTAVSGHVNNNNKHFNSRSYGSSPLTTTTTGLTSSISSLSSSLLSSTSSFTKGGVAKRVFKPTIPTTRRSSRPGVSGVSGGESRDQNNSCNGKLTNSKVKGKEKSGKPKGKKDLIQLDATFNGINITSPALKAERAFISPGGSGFGNDTRTLRSSQSDSLRGIGSSGGGAGSIVNGCVVKLENNETCYGNNLKPVNIVDDHHGGDEEDVESIQRVLYRDDFVSPYDPNEQDMTPIGWKCVSQHQVVKQEDKKGCKPSLRRFDKWASTKKDQDKMVLFQLPEMLLNSGDGQVGKLRMYQSGKMELVDTRSGLVYDLLHTDCDVNPHPDEYESDEDENNGDNETTSEDNNEEVKEEEVEGEEETRGSQFSTDWIKKEVDEDKVNPRNYDFLPPPPIPSRPSTSKSSSYLSPSSLQSHSTTSPLPSHSSSKLSKSSKAKLPSTKSTSSSKNLKANKSNRRNNCDKDGDNDNGTDDDDDNDQDTDDDDDDGFNRNINQSYREACTFDGKQIVCLGPISNNQLLIGRPRLDKFINL